MSTQDTTERRAYYRIQDKIALQISPPAEALQDAPLFNLLNEIYDNGVNDVQSLIAVSILGEMHNDETLLSNCVDYMSDELCVNVIRINKYLASSAGRSARIRLENPPRYKPKKAKKNSLLSSLMGGAGAGLQQ